MSSTPDQVFSSLDETKDYLNIARSNDDSNEKIQTARNAADNYTATQIRLHATIPINEPDPEYIDCDAPSRDNPFMNVLVSDIQHNPHKKKACKITDTKVRAQVENNFNYNLYKDVTDVYSKNNSQRQFVANPVTTIPNEQGKFANFLYNWKSSCKEDPKSCLRYEDIRQKREWAQSPKRKPMI